MYRHSCTIENVVKFADWIKNRGGVAIWKSVDLSDPAFSMSSPATDKNGKPFTKPHWKCVDVPEVVTDPKEIEVYQRQEFKRFHVAIRPGAQGFKLKLTDASSRSLERFLAQAGEGSSYEFDYGMQEAIVYKVSESISLAEWISANMVEEKG